MLIVRYCEGSRWWQGVPIDRVTITNAKGDGGDREAGWQGDKMLFQMAGILILEQGACFGVHRATEVNTNTMQSGKVQDNSLRYWQAREESNGAKGWGRMGSVEWEYGEGERRE